MTNDALVLQEERVAKRELRETLEAIDAGRTDG
jgi:hypothetical protein